MGIPFLFKTLVDQWPDIMQPISAEECALYVDFNSIVHGCAQDLLLVHPVSKTPSVSFEDSVIHASLRAVEHIAQVVSASYVYIATDGNCPRAKMQQQRRRRYLDHWKRAILTGGDNDNRSWRSACVTPGTAFMKKLDRAVTKHVKSRAKTWDASPSSVFGEGEHKIFQHMKMHGQHRHNIICGGDADLILLSMLALADNNDTHKISILRNPTDDRVIDVCRLRTHFDVLLDSADSISASRDLCVLCTVLGNDFLPSIPCLNLRNDGFMRIVRWYKAVAKSTGMRLVDTERDDAIALNTTFLTRFFDLLGAKEDIYMREIYDTHKAQMIARRHGGDAGEAALLKRHDMPLEKINVLNPGWRPSYYYNMFPEYTSQVEVCRLYIEGLHWVFEYYVTGKHNAAWYYPYDYAPTALDLYNYMFENEHMDMNAVTLSTHPSHGHFLKLIKSCSKLHGLVVIPPQLLETVLDDRDKWLHVVNDISYGQSHLFPVAFRIRTYLKTHLWECIPDIPNVNITNLHSALTRTHSTPNTKKN